MRPSVNVKEKWRSVDTSVAHHGKHIAEVRFGWLIVLDDWSIRDLFYSTPFRTPTSISGFQISRM